MVVAVLLRLLFGIGEAAAFVGLATAIQDLAPDDRRGEATSYFSVATYGGVAIGPPLGQYVLDRGGYDSVWLAAAGVVVIGMVLGLGTPSGIPASARAHGAPDDEAHATAKSQRRAALHPAAIRPGLAVAAALVGYSGFVSFVALYVEDEGIVSPGVVFSTYAVLIVVFRLLAAKVPDRFGAIRVSAVSVLSLASGLLVMAAVPNGVGLFAGVVLFAFGMALNFPALLALVVNQVGPADRTYAVASFSVFFDIGFGLGGPLVGAVVALTGAVRWGFVGGAVTLSSLLWLRSMRAR